MTRLMLLYDTHNFLSLLQFREKTMVDIFSIDKINTYRENNRLEAKLAKKAVPDSVWATYSSFANTDGGIILLAVEERKVTA